MSVLEQLGTGGIIENSYTQWRERIIKSVCGAVDKNAQLNCVCGINEREYLYHHMISDRNLRYGRGGGHQSKVRSDCELIDSPVNPVYYTVAYWMHYEY